MKSTSWLGNVSHLDGYSGVICSDHAAELRQHFRMGGIEAFGRSTVAGALYRAELYASWTKPCVKCGGHVWEGPEDPIPERVGCGFIPSKSKRNLAVTAKQREWLALLDLDGIAPPPVAADFPCPDCECRGWVPTGKHATGPITARPTGTKSRQEPSIGSVDMDLQILAVCSRRLERADVLFRETSTVLAAYLEPDGGLPLSLWHLVPAGKTWLKQNKTALPPRHFFEAARIVQETNCDAKVRLVIKTCDEQAKAILEVAGKAWNAAVACEQTEAAE